MKIICTSTVKINTPARRKRKSLYNTKVNYSQHSEQQNIVKIANTNQQMANETVDNSCEIVKQNMTSIAESPV